MLVLCLPSIYSFLTAMLIIWLGNNIFCTILRGGLISYLICFYVQVGLEDVGTFLKKRKRRAAGPKKLYCSMISSVFEQKKYPDISRNSIVELLPNKPHTITVRNDTTVYCLRVTAINANHCPGSLMFLMEKLDFAGEVSKRILYTGDFRFDNLLGKSLTTLQVFTSGTDPLH